MGVDFQIENEGPKLGDWTSPESLKKLKTLDPYQSTPFVGQTLRNLRREVGNEATVLGFVGAPFTLASYMIEGGSSDDFVATKKMMYSSPATLHQLLSHLAENIAAYASYQIKHGAQVIQLFDSWAGTLSPIDYDTFALPYQQSIISKIKLDHPKVPVIIFAAKSGAIVEKLAESGAHCISLDWTTGIRHTRERIKNPKMVIQGNLDPLVLLAPKEVIRDRTMRILKEGHRKKKSPIKRHIMNLGHGVYTETPEENVQYFVDTVKEYRLPKRIRLRPQDYDADDSDESESGEEDGDNEEFE
jgi:uroporphyrinogen decarboxylase